MAYSYNRLSWMCRLHTEECTLGPCVGSLHSKKEGWDMTRFNDCSCAEGRVCVQRDDNNGFVCEIKECNFPGEPANGKIFGNDVRVGRHIRCDCEQGYVPDGELTRECHGNGTWSGEEPKCKTVTADTFHLCAGLCKERPICMAYSYNRLSWMCRLHTEECTLGPCVGSLHSKKEGWDMTRFNDCSCAEGRVCVQRDDNNGFVCEIKECNFPGEPANGKIFGNDVRVGRHIRCDCEQGYVPDGELTRECHGNGTWSGEEPKCKTVTACPVVGSKEWGQSCYFIVTSTSLKKTFSDASDYCAVDGGHLIHVTSQEEHEYISSQLIKPTNVAATLYWIGVVRNNTNGNWYLSDNDTPIVYDSWADIEPQGGNDCAAYKYEETAPSKWLWFSQSCTDFPRYPLCEYDL